MDYIYVGTITGTHGIKGEVKVKSDSSFKAERFKKNNTLYLKYKNEMTKIAIDSYRTHKNFDLITFNNITDVNEVINYVNCDIYVHKNQLADLGQEEYYYHQLIGLKVVQTNGNIIGKVVDIQDVPQGEILVIEKKDGKQRLVPFVDSFINNIDLKKQEIVIIPIEGLL